MTFPNGAAGVNPDATDGVTGDDGSLPNQSTLDQTAAIALLKDRHIASSPGWTGATASAWSGMRRGTLANPVPFNLAIIEQLVSKLLNLPPGTWDSFNHAVDDLGTYANNIFTALGQFNLADPSFDFNAWAQNFVQIIIAPFVALINPLLGNEEQGNLLAAGGFKDAVSLSSTIGWSWDAAVGRTAAGSAKASPTGSTLALVSNKIAVAEGQLLNVEVWLKWSGVSASGVAFKLDLNLYDKDDSLLGATTRDSVSSPATNQTVWQKLSDIYTVTAGIAAVRVRFLVQNTTAGSIWWDDAAVAKTTLIAAALNDIWDAFGGSGPGAVSDGWSNLLALFGLTPTQATIDATPAALPPTNVSGVQGIQTLDETVKTMWNQWLAAFGLSTPTTGSTLPQVSSAAQTTAQNAQDANIMATNATNILGQRNNAPTTSGLDNTSESNMDIHSVDTSIAIHSANASIVGLVRCTRSNLIGAVSFIVGKNLSPPGGFYVNIYKVDFAGSNLDFLYATADLTSSITGGGATMRRIVLPGANNFQVEPGDVIAVELCANFGATLSASPLFIAFGRDTGIGNHPTALLQNVGYSISGHGSPAAETIDRALVGTDFHSYAPYICLEVSNLPADYHLPETPSYGVAGSHSYVIPVWANFVDLIAVGGGNRGNVIFGGGTGGTWADTTLTLPTGSVAAGDTLDIVVGAGGTSAPTNGLASTVKKGATSLLSAAGSSGFTGTDIGASPGDHSYLGRNYWGGPSVWLDANGNIPGGGGGKTLNGALHGGNGGVWIVARQT